MSQNADNFRFDITAWQGHYDKRDILAECLRLAFADHRAATHWSSDGKRLILYWSEGNHPTNALISPIGADTAAVLVREWLAKAEYPEQPDHDGSNSKGWRVYNEAWGHVADDPYAICAVEPHWLMHGK